MKLLLSYLLLLISVASVAAQSDAITYQGKLSDGVAPANGQYDLVFRLFAADTGGSELAPAVALENVQVTEGVFKVELSFNFTPFTTVAAQWVEIAVRPGTSTGAFTTVTPRQHITSAPYAMQSAFSTFSTTATNATQLGGVAANQYVVTTDPRMTDARPPTSGSASYIQNSLTQQASSNFSISGEGRAGTFRGSIFDASSEYRIAGSAILRNVGDNLAVGTASGDPSSGLGNTYAGARSGQAATSNASNNAFFGFESGKSNSAGLNNSFFGYRSGFGNSTGGFNAFFGSTAGSMNVSGNRNAYFGASAGASSVDSSDNAFFGGSAGQNTGTGSQNAFVGGASGFFNTSGASNAFLGYNTGHANLSGTGNTAVGAFSNFGAGNLTNATAIGSRSFVTQSNSLILGGVNGQNGAVTDTNVGIGTTAPTQRLHVVGNGLFSGDLTVNGTLNAALPAGSSNYIQNSTTAQASSNFNISGTGKAGILDASQFKLGGTTALRTGGDNFSMYLGVGAGDQIPPVATNEGANTIFGAFAGSVNFVPGTQSRENVFMGWLSGRQVSGQSNTFIGTQAGYMGNGTPVSLDEVTLLGSRTRAAVGSTNATAIGAGALVEQSNSLVLGQVGINAGVGTTAPSFRFHVKADGQDGIKIQHTGVGAFPQVRFTDLNDVFKASIGVDTSGTGSMNFFVNGADRMILKSNGVVQVPGPIVINNPNTLIITSPNGACWGLTVSNSGALTTFPVTPCP
jgi:hypothetical protein